MPIIPRLQVAAKTACAGQRGRTFQSAAVRIFFQFLQCNSEILHGLKSPCYILTKAPRKDLLQIVWNLLTQAIGFLAKNGRHC
jgi:hypothetical protein